MSLNEKVLRWLFLGASIWLCFFLHLGKAQLFDTEEGSFAIATLAMFQNGDPLRAFADGQLLLADAPLIHWLQSLSLKIFGLNEAALRLPSALAASLWLIAIYRFAKARVGWLTACYAVGFMSCSLAVVIIGRSASSESLFNLFLTLCMFDLYQWCEGERKRHLFRAFIWAALGVLSKGLLALVIPGLVVSVYLLSANRWRDLLSTVLYWPGWMVLLAVAMPWFVYQYSVHGISFLTAFFLDSFVYQFTQTYEKYSSPLYYLYTLPLVVLPFSYVAMVALWRAGQTWSTPFNRYMLCWFSVVLVSFSAGGKMQPNYLLYGCTALFLLMAKFREDYSNRTLTLLPLILFATVCAALPLIFHYYDPGERTFDAAIVELGRTALFDDNYWAPAALFLVLSIWLSFNKKFKPIESLALGAYVQTAFVATTLATVVGDVQQGSVEIAAEKALKANVQLVQWRANMPSLGFYRRSSVPSREPLAGEWVYVPIHKTDGLPPLLEKHRHGGYLLAEVLEVKK